MATLKTPLFAVGPRNRVQLPVCCFLFNDLRLWPGPSFTDICSDYSSSYYDLIAGLSSPVTCRVVVALAIESSIGTYQDCTTVDCRAGASITMLCGIDDIEDWNLDKTRDVGSISGTATRSVHPLLGTLDRPISRHGPQEVDIRCGCIKNRNGIIAVVNIKSLVGLYGAHAWRLVGVCVATVDHAVSVGYEHSSWCHPSPLKVKLVVQRG